MSWFHALSTDAQLGLVSNALLALLTVAGWMLAFMSGRWSEREGKRSEIRDEGRRSLLRFIDATLEATSNLRSMLLSASNSLGDDSGMWLLDRHHDAFTEAENELRASQADFRRNAPLIGIDAWSKHIILLRMCTSDLWTL